MNVLLVEPRGDKEWGKYNQYHGLLKIGAYHKSLHDKVFHVVGNVVPGMLDERVIDKVYIASLFSYWEHHYIDAIMFHRLHYPDAEIIFGGIHAINALPRVKKWAKELGVRIIPRMELAQTYRPAIELVPTNMASLLTSRGCPNACTYCSVNNIYGSKWTPRDVGDIIDEIRTQIHYGATEFALYDDNFLYSAETHALPLLKEIAKLQTMLSKRVLFSVPSGFQASHMTPTIAKWMWRANFRGRISTSIESVDVGVLSTMGRGSWSSDTNLEHCVHYMSDAGYKSIGLTVYYICGLPYQTIESMLATAIAIGRMGCVANMQRFAPIPGTKDFERCGLEMMDMDMRETNGDTFVAPDQDNFTDEDLRAIAAFTRWQNAAMFYTFGRVNMYEEQTNRTLKRAMGMVGEMLRNPCPVYVPAPLEDEPNSSTGFGF